MRAKLFNIGGYSATAVVQKMFILDITVTDQEGFVKLVKEKIKHREPLISVEENIVGIQYHATATDAYVTEIEDALRQAEEELVNAARIRDLMKITGGDQNEVD